MSWFLSQITTDDIWCFSRHLTSLVSPVNQHWGGPYFKTKTPITSAVIDWSKVPRLCAIGCFRSVTSLIFNATEYYLAYKTPYLSIGRDRSSVKNHDLASFFFSIMSRPDTGHPRHHSSELSASSPGSSNWGSSAMLKHTHPAWASSVIESKA